MGLKAIESKDVTTLMTQGVYNYQPAPLRSAGFANLAALPPARTIVYYDRLDVMVGVGIEAHGFSGFDRVLHLDPLGFEKTVPTAQAFDPGGNSASRMAVGEWDRVANTQRVYAGATPPDEIWEFDTTGWVMLETDLYPSLFGWDRSAAALTTIGAWDDALAQGDFVFFETWGFALRAAVELRHTDNVLYRGMALIDLTTGLGTLLNVPTFYTGTPRALFEAVTFNGDNFTLGDIQFVPDDDSVPAAPKGRIFLGSVNALNAGLVSPGDTYWKYVKAIEWNPLGVAPLPGNSNRVHLRELFLSRVIFRWDEAFGTAVNSAGTNSDGGSNPSGTGRERTMFHPPTRTLRTWLDHRSVADANERGYVVHSITPELTAIDPVAPIAEVETNKTLTFRSRAFGDLAEPIAGLVATWTLERASTFRETLLTSGAPATSTVANPPIDAGSLVVEHDPGSGFVVLATPADYTVVEATGVITWAGAHAPPLAGTYAATYEHRTVPTTPAHGTLLQASSTTEVDGRADTRVQYPDDDDDAGQFDELSVSITDD